MEEKELCRSNKSGKKKKSAAGYTFTLFGIISEMNFQT